MEDNKEMCTYKLVDKEKFFANQRDDYNEYIMETYGLGEGDLLVGSFNDNEAFNIAGTEDYLTGQEMFHCFRKVEETCGEPEVETFEEVLEVIEEVSKPSKEYISYFHAAKVILGREFYLVEWSLLLVLYTTLGYYMGMEFDLLFKICNLAAGLLFTCYVIQATSWLFLARVVVAKAKEEDYNNMLLYYSWFGGGKE